MKKLLVVFVVLAVTFSPMALSSFADCGHCKKGDGHKKEQGLDEKFLHKAHFLMENKDELGLTDKQVEKIKDLKLKTKKDLIRKEADIEVLALDIKSALWQDTVDAEAVNKLVDKKYEVKKEKTKMLVSAYAELKNSLTKEQKEKMKELWKACDKKKGCDHSDKGKCKMCDKR